MLGPMLERFPRLKVVLEHITTREAAQFVEVTGAERRRHHHRAPPALNRNALFLGGIRPHHYCLPVLKREEHREALVEAATSRQSEVLPRHRQRAARARHQGGGLRLRRHLHRARRDRALRRGLRGGRRARQARRLRQRVRRAVLRPAAEQQQHHAGARGMDACPSGSSSAAMPRSSPAAMRKPAGLTGPPRPVVDPAPEAGYPARPYFHAEAGPVKGRLGV